ncbi:MAG: rhomboid family intramembrane serine protease [Solirubrobacterales bacterium]
MTECPYCGTRLRKRAPKLERQGDELTPRESRRQRRRRERAERRDHQTRARLLMGEGERRYAVIAAVLAPALLVLVQRAGDLPITDVGGIVGPVDGEWWRYLAAPFAYPDVGYLFVVSVGIVIFGVAVESRLGMIATVILIVACGALGMLAADGVESAIGGEDNLLLAAGGNGIALGLLATWAVLRAGEMRADPTAETEVIGAAVAATVLIMLPLVEDYANVFAGLGGALVGAVSGLAAALARRERKPG